MIKWFYKIFKLLYIHALRSVWLILSTFSLQQVSINFYVSRMTVRKTVHLFGFIHSSIDNRYHDCPFNAYFDYYGLFLYWPRLFALCSYFDVFFPFSMMQCFIIKGLNVVWFQITQWNNLHEFMYGTLFFSENTDGKKWPVLGAELPLFRRLRQDFISYFKH